MGRQSLRQFYEMLDESQWWPAMRMARWQQSLLAPLLNHARATAPFYRYRLAKLFGPGGAIDWSRWSDIPILTRRDVSQYHANLLSSAPPEQHGPFADVSSSGSTGHPVTVRTTRWLSEMSQACNWRAHRWADLDWSKTLLARGNTVEGQPIGAELGTWGPPWLPGAAHGQRLHTNYSNPYAADAEILRRQSVYAYSGTTNQLEAFFENPALPDLPDLKVVMPRGGAISDYLRAQVARVSAARIVGAYSSKEGGALARPCPAGHGFHINAEAALVEIVDDAGRPVEPGETGHVVVTPFASTAMPLIRYDQGDVATAGGTCPCGRHLPLISRLEGRTSAVFLHPDGRRSREMMPIEARQLLGAGRWQVRQVGPIEFEVDYVRHDWGTAPDLDAFRAMFRTVFFDDAVVSVQAVDDLTLNANGKYREYENRWQQG